jgi:hypothetical protein
VWSDRRWSGLAWWIDLSVNNGEIGEFGRITNRDEESPAFVVEGTSGASSDEHESWGDYHSTSYNSQQ